MLPVHRLDGPAGAPFVVLGNSLGTTSELWAPQLPALAERFRVLRYEHRGHGGCAAPEGPYTIDDLAGDVVELLDHLGVERASFAGISLGGMVAMRLAAAHPARVDKVVLACTAAALPPESAWRDRAALVRAEGTRSLLDVLVSRWFVEPTAALAGIVDDMLGTVDVEGYAGCCEAIAAMDQRGDIGSITADTLVVAGAGDPVVGPAQAVELQQAIPGAGLVVIPRAAHLANLEQPAAFTAVLLDHLAGRAAERGRAARAAVLGDEHVRRSEAKAAADPFLGPFVDLITRNAWGEVWTRPGLDAATRSCITLALLVAGARWDELPLHVRGAVRNGLTEQQIGEVLLHASVYWGVPAANTAFAIAADVLAELRDS